MFPQEVPLRRVKASAYVIPSSRYATLAEPLMLFIEILLILAQKSFFQVLIQRIRTKPDGQHGV